MNNIKICTEYIKDTIVNPLKILMGDDTIEEVNIWEKYGSKGITPQKDKTYKFLLHVTMQPYYEMYLNGDTSLCKENIEMVRLRLKTAIDEDVLFGSWASKQDLITSAMDWGDNIKRFPQKKRIYQYFRILDVLLQKDCVQDWHRLSEELKEMLFKAEVYSDYKTDEVLCILHAFTMIMQQDWSKEKKNENLSLLNNNWMFLKHYYSVMIRHIVGVKYTRFSDVSKTVMESSQSFKPHLHIFFCGLIDCVDELNLDKKQRQTMDKIILQMQEEISRCEPSEMLYELCDTLFPEDFQRMLREHRPKSYKEIEDESRQKDDLIKQMKEQTRRTRNELDKAKEMLQQMVLSAIPIEDIEAELDQYPSSIAWDMLKELNANPVISMQDAWREHYPAMLKKYRVRMFDTIELQKSLNDAMQKMAKRPFVHIEKAADVIADGGKKIIKHINEAV